MAPDTVMSLPKNGISYEARCIVTSCSSRDNMTSSKAVVFRMRTNFYVVKRIECRPLPKCQHGTNNNITANRWMMDLLIG